MSLRRMKEKFQKLTAFEREGYRPSRRSIFRVRNSTRVQRNISEVIVGLET